MQTRYASAHPERGQLACPTDAVQNPRLMCFESRSGIFLVLNNKYANERWKCRRMAGRIF
jgi:hypothetical protein